MACTHSQIANIDFFALYTHGTFMIFTDAHIAPTALFPLLGYTDCAHLFGLARILFSKDLFRVQVGRDAGLDASRGEGSCGGTDSRTIHDTLILHIHIDGAPHTACVYTLLYVCHHTAQG